MALMCRQQRMAELKARSEKARFGDVREITAVDYVQEVNKAGDGIMVVLHLYKQVPVPTILSWWSCSNIYRYRHKLFTDKKNENVQRLPVNNRCWNL
jgi:hypothetical protein